MYLKIRKTRQQKARFGEDIVVTLIWLYDDNDKWIKWIKLDNNTGIMLTTLKIPLWSDHLFDNPLQS